jgi:FMN reductase
VSNAWSPLSNTGEDGVEQRRPLILGIGGSHRPEAATDQALRIALAAAESEGADTEFIGGCDLQLPIYGTADPEAMPTLRRFLGLYQSCDGLLMASPGYHGSISGLLKNALDFTDVLRSTGKPYLDGKAVGCIVCAYGWQATGTTLTAMRTIVHALRGWPTPLGVAINSSLPFTDGHGSCVDTSVKLQLETVARQVVEFARMQILSQGHALAHAGAV